MKAIAAVCLGLGLLAAGLAMAQTAQPVATASPIDQHALQLAREDIALSIEPKLRDVFLKNPGTAEFLEAEARAYTRQFSVSELEQIHVFRASPVGQRLASISTWIDKDPDVIAVKRHQMDLFQVQLRRNLAALPSADQAPNSSGVPQTNSASASAGQDASVPSSDKH